MLILDKPREMLAALSGQAFNEKDGGFN